MSNNLPLDRPVLLSYYHVLFCIVLHFVAGNFCIRPILYIVDFI